jgi:hypothetical protein
VDPQRHHEAFVGEQRRVDSVRQVPQVLQRLGRQMLQLVQRSPQLLGSGVDGGTGESEVDP